MKYFLIILLSLTMTYAFADDINPEITKKIKTNNKRAVLSANGNLSSTTILSKAIITEDTIYISGQIPIDSETGKLIEGSFPEKFTQALKNLQAIAESANGNLDDINKLTIYLTDMSNYDDVNTVMQSFFTRPYPARSVIGIKELPFGATVEVEAIMQRKK